MFSVKKCDAQIIVSTPKLRQDHRSDLSKETRPVVYAGLFDRETNPRFKVGYSSDDWKAREKAHKLFARKAAKEGEEGTYETLVIVQGLQEHENAIHKAFRDYQYNGIEDTFHPRPEVADWIRWMRDQHYCYVPDDTETVLPEHLPIVAYDLWKPIPEHRKSPADDCPLLIDCPGANLFFPSRLLQIDDYYTNATVIEAARDALGGIDLDPASHPVANRVVKATRIYTREENGLLQSWSGKVWLNPPFSLWEDWVPKVVKEAKNPNVEAMCIFAACGTITAKYYKPLRESSTALALLNGRFPLWGKLAGNNLNDGHCVFYFGRDPERFADAFRPIGTSYRTMP